MKALKPGYDSEAVQKELVDRVCAYFGRVYDDYEAERIAALRGHRRGDEYWVEIMGEDATINETAEEFGITPSKVRKLLVTGGYFDTEQYREIKKRKDQGQTVAQIAAALGKGVGAIQSYLPYERVIYNLEERSVNADRLQRFKERHGGYKAKAKEGKKKMTKAQEKALSLINYMLGHSRDDGSDGLFFSHKYSDGWSVCLDVYSENSLWMVDSSECEAEIKQTLAGEGKICPGQIYCCAEDMIEDSFRIGLRLIDGKAVQVEPYAYEKNVTGVYMTINYAGEKHEINQLTGEETKVVKPNLMKVKFDKFIRMTSDYNMSELLKALKAEEGEKNTSETAGNE